MENYQSSPQYHQPPLDFELDTPISPINEVKKEQKGLANWKVSSPFSSDESIYDIKANLRGTQELTEVLNIPQVINREVQKTKKLLVLTYILNQYTIEIRLKYSFEFFKKLKEIYDKNCLSKLALDKLNKVFKTLEFDNSRDFFSNFLSKFATKKRLFEFNCYQNMSQIRIPSKKTKKILCLSPTRKFKQIFKLYKDQLSDLTYKQRLLTEGDLKYFLSRQNACFSIITLIHSHKTHILQLSFKRILTKALNSITGEEMTGYKGFSKYSIILLPFKDKYNLVKQSELIHPCESNLYTPNKCKNFGSSRKTPLSMISPMPQRLLSNRIVKIGEFSENTCSKFYESSIYMSPEQRIDRYHRKLNSLSKIIDKKFPNIRSRQLDRFVLYEHGLMQAFRVVDTALKRKKMTVFKEIDSLAISRIKKRELILIILNIYKRNKLYCLDKYMKKWNKKDSFTSKYKKLCNFLVQRSFQDLNIGFGKIQVFSLQTKIKSLLYSKQMQFQQENALIEEKNKLKAKIVMLNFFNSLDNKLQFRNKKEKQRVFSKIIMKGRIIKRLEDLCRKYICLGGKKNKKIISDKIRDFFIKKRILIKLINFFKSKTLKKSFWALKHWKSYVNKGNAVKGLYFIGGMEKLLGKTKKIGFDIMKRHKNSDDLEKKIVLKHLLKTLKKKIMQRKKEVLDVLNKNSKRITEENKRKLQNSLFLSKLLQLIFQKANEKIKKDVFLSLKEKIEKKSNKEAITSRDSISNTTNYNQNYGKIKKVNRNQNIEKNEENLMKDDMEIISSIYKTLSNEKEQYANKDKHFINLNMPGVQPEHSIATIKRNTKHIKNNIDDVKNYDINRENYENKEKFINLYHNCKNEDLYGSHHNNNSFLERNYEKSLEKFKKISPEFNEEVNYEKLPKKTIQSQKIEEKENISIPDKRNSRNSFILEKSDNEEKNSPKKRFSYNRMKIERDRFSRNDLERDISRILKDEYVNELLVESTIIHKEKQKPDIKENQFYKNLFTEIVDDKFSCGNIEKTVKKVKGNCYLDSKKELQSDRTEKDDIRYILSPEKFPIQTINISKYLNIQHDEDYLVKKVRSYSNLPKKLLQPIFLNHCMDNN